VATDTAEIDVIRVRVGNPQQLFNSVDPSPFVERDLDPACVEFIVNWARELAQDHDLRLEIDIGAGHRENPLLAEIPTAVRAHFEREVYMQDLRVRRVMREARTSLGLGLGILALCMTAAALISAQGLGVMGRFDTVGAFGTIRDIVAESLVIAGWVAMWHPVHTLLYGYWPVTRERRLFERLARAEVDVIPA